MASLQYTVWRTASEVALGDVLNEGVITIDVSSAQSGVMKDTMENRNCRVRLMADADCWVTWGEDPTALNDGTGGRMLGAENPEYFDIRADYKIAVIQR